MVRAEYTTRFAGGAAGFVYIVTAENGLSKIGASRSLRGRIDYIRTASALPVEVARVYDAERYRALEVALHGFMSHRLERGEWFRLTADDLTRIDAYVFSRVTQDEYGRASRLSARTGRVVRSWRRANDDTETALLSGEPFAEPILGRPRITPAELDAMIAGWFGWMERTREELEPSPAIVPAASPAPRQPSLFDESAA